MNQAAGPNDPTITRRLRVEPTRVPDPGIPVRMLMQGIQRLRIVVGVIVLLTVIGWLGVNALEGDLGDEFRRPGDWLPPTIGLAASLGLLLMTYSSAFSVLTILKAGLVYEVLVSFGMAIGQYWNTFHDLPADRLTPDLVGVSAVALWMAFFTVLVPTRPRHALVALILSGAAVPLTIVALIRLGDVEPLPPVVFFPVFVLPYAITIFMCLVAANVIYGLGRDATAAQRLGSYQLLDLIGSGGMGEVWRARHQLLARPAAIKLIRADNLSTDPLTQRAIIERFEREAQVIASLESPHTVELFDFGVSDTGEVYYVMELLRGIDLEQLVRRFGPLSPARTVHVLRQVCASLAEAHQRGLVHRDIKPANIMLCVNALVHDFVKVLDFGLARQAVNSGGDSAVDVTASDPGKIVGTPHYIPPESLAAGGRVDARADIYSLGCVAYWLLTGRPVFPRSTAVAALAAHLNDDPEAPSLHSHEPLGTDLDALVLRCLEKDPELRPGSAEELDGLLSIDLYHPHWTAEQAKGWWAVHPEVQIIGNPVPSVHRQAHSR